MSESRPDEDAAQSLEHDAAELDERIQHLEDHIEDAERKAHARAEEANPGEAAAGDWDETRGTPGQGEDPEGAADEGADRH